MRFQNILDLKYAEYQKLEKSFAAGQKLQAEAGFGGMVAALLTGAALFWAGSNFVGKASEDPALHQSVNHATDAVKNIGTRTLQDIGNQVMDAAQVGLNGAEQGIQASQEKLKIVQEKFNKSLEQKLKANLGKAISADQVKQVVNNSVQQTNNELGRVLTPAEENELFNKMVAQTEANLAKAEYYNSKLMPSQ